MRLSARHNLTACRDLFCTGCSPLPVCVGALFADFPPVKSPENAGSSSEQQKASPRTEEAAWAAKLGSQILRWLGSPRRPDEGAVLCDSRNAGTILNAPFRNGVDKPASLAKETVILSSSSQETEETATPMWSLSTETGDELSDTSSSPRDSDRYFPNIPLVQSPDEAPGIFQPLRNESYRYFPHMPLVQSPIQVADLGRPLSSLSLDLLDEASTDSNTLCPSSSSGTGNWARSQNLRSGLFHVLPRSRALKRWRDVKAGRRVGSVKIETESGSRNTLPGRRRWIKPLRKAARWVSLRKRHSGSFVTQPTRNQPRRRGAMWRQPSKHDYSVYFPRAPSLLPDIVPTSPSSVYSQESYQTLSGGDTGSSHAADDELGSSIAELSDAAALTPVTNCPSARPAKEQTLRDWLSMPSRDMCLTDAMHYIGWLAFRSTRLVLRVTLFAVPPLAAWAVFRASEVALRSAPPPY